MRYRLYEDRIDNTYLQDALKDGWEQIEKIGKIIIVKKNCQENYRNNKSIISARKSAFYISFMSIKQKLEKRFDLSKGYEVVILIVPNESKE